MLSWRVNNGLDGSNNHYVAYTTASLGDIFLSKWLYELDKVGFSSVTKVILVEK